MGNSIFNIENCFISKLLETKDMVTVNDSQIKPHFFTGDHRNAYQFIQEVYSETGEVPTVRVFKSKFPSYKLEMHYEGDADNKTVGTDENLQYWCSEMRRKAKHNAIADMLEEAAESLSSFDTDDAYTNIRKRISFIESEVEETTSVDITKNTEERVQYYLKKKINKGMHGISTGMPKLDFMTKGFAKGTLTVLISKTGVGKSWMSILWASQACLDGYKVLFLVTEMSQEGTRERFEAVLYYLTNGGIDYGKLKAGTLDRDTELSYFKFLREDMPALDSLILADGTSPLGVSAAIETYEPDIVFIDSVYLMEDDARAKEDWLRMTHITRDLKKISKRHNIPIIINTQADKNSNKKVGPELESIMYTQSIGMDADLIMAMFRNDLMISDKESCLKLLKNREGTLGRVMLNWDFAPMNFSEIYAEEESGEQEDKPKGVRITIDEGDD